MARARSPNRDKAFEIWKESNGKKPLVEIAKELNMSEGTVRGWKAKDKWDSKMNGTLQPNERNAPKEKPKKHGAPLGNKNALGNKGGAAPKGNRNAVKHGLFAKYLPKETLEIIEQMDGVSMLDILWMTIQMKFAQILRSQQIMHVENQEDITKIKTMESSGMQSDAVAYLVQTAADKQAASLKAQSRAMAELRSLIKQFDEMSPDSDSRKLEVERMETAIAKTKKETEFIEERTKLLKGVKKDTGLLNALIKTVTEDE